MGHNNNVMNLIHHARHRMQAIPQELAPVTVQAARLVLPSTSAGVVTQPE